MTEQRELNEVTEQVERRRREAVSQWGLSDEIVLVGAGEPIHVPGRADRTYPFRSHSEYLYLTDRERPGGVLAFDPREGWTDFVRGVTREERVWSGSADHDEGVPLEQFEPWLRERHGRPIGCLGSPLPGATSDPGIGADLRYVLNRVRRRKDAVELSRMRAAERATRAGFDALASLLKPSMTERAVRIEIEAAFFRHGADGVAYDTIVGGGPNSAVLHFQPTARPFRDGELVLVDAGAEYRGYASDVSRTYPVSGGFSSEQAELYALVLAVERAAIGRCGPGVEYRDIHDAACAQIAQGLVDVGLLRGHADSLVEQRVQALFFPHGVGHMVGLGVRDAGEILRGREERNEASVPRLRVDLPLEPGHVVTIEPGIYFIPALLQDPDLRQRHRDAVCWERVDRMLEWGGIRIEDNVLVTEDGFEVLTSDVAVAQ